MAEQTNDKQEKKVQKRDMPWCLAKVVSIDDPDHRRRIRVRGPKENDEEALPDDALPWIQPCQLMPTYFALPNVGEPVLLLKYGMLVQWLELPDKSAWQDFGDDYATAWLITHKDKYKLLFTESNGFDITYVGNVTVNTDKTQLTITGDAVTFTYNDVQITTDGSSLTAKVKDVEFSTDGSKATLKNGSQSLADVLDRLETALISHTHQGITPTSPPINIADFNKNKADFKQLLQ